MIGSPSYESRRALAEAVRSRRDGVADAVTQEFLARHPEWVRRYGDVAWLRGVEDARFHVDFLAGALQSGSPAAMEDYARWTARVLGSRGIEATFLAENLLQVRDKLREVLDDDDAGLVARYVDAACAAIASDGAGAGGALHPAPSPDEELETDRGLYLQAILGGQRQAALNIALESLRRGLSVPDVYCDVLQPAQYEIGRLWERNEISVAREHMATAITQYVVAQLYSRIDLPGTSRGRALVTGVERELHQLGANMVSDVLEADGWDVRFLGTQMPHRDILRAIEEHRPAVVGISTTMLFNVPRVADLIERIGAGFGEELRVVVGGGAFRNAPGLWEEIGAHGFGGDLREAVAAVEALLPRVAG